MALLWLVVVAVEQTAAAVEAGADLPMVFSTLCRGRCCPLLLLVQRERRAQRAGPRLSAQFLPLRAEPAALVQAALELQTQACVALLPPTAETVAAVAALAAVVALALCMGMAVQAVLVALPALAAVARVVTVQSVEQAETVAAVAVALVLVITVAPPAPLVAVVAAQRPLRS